MGDVVLLVAKITKNSAVSSCRICHQSELESGKSLEAPCACSGTVKFAHRDCTQRWCNEKGNTTCEICLQEYGPGYVAEGLNTENEFSQCTFADRGVSCCRFLALALTIVLLVRNTITVLSGEAMEYSFTPPAILVCKVTGIVLPMLAIMRTITAVQNSVSRPGQSHDTDIDTSNPEEDIEQQRYTEL